MLAVQSNEVADLLDRGRRLHASGFAAEAYQAFLAAFQHAPNDARVQSRVGDFLLARGELDDAQRFFSLAASEGDIAGLCGLVEVRERRGQLDAAWALIEQVPGAIERSLALRVVAARLLARTGRAEQACALLSEIDSGALSNSDAAGVSYQLGDLHHELGDTERAFAAWTRANRRRQLAFERRAHERKIDDVIAAHDETTLSSLPTGSQSDRPVFIVGIPRSGTTLVEQILAAHPQIFGAGELPDINVLAQATERSNPDQVQRATKSYLQRIQQLDRDALRVTDKMPFNAMRLGFIAQLFPNAKIIHCVRDAGDVALSIFGRNFSDWHSYAGSLRDIAVYIAEHERLMAHWREVLPLEIHDVRYEDLVRRGEDAMRELVDHVGLDWDPAVTAFHRSGRAVTTASHAQVQKPLYETSIGRCRAYSKQLRAFRRELGRARDRGRRHAEPAAPVARSTG